MTTLRPFRFGVQAGWLTDAVGWTELARRCEDVGVSTLTMADHLDEQLAPIAGLMAAAAATTTLRIGALVFCNDYRHPAVLAKEAATLDVLSDGRFELGLGAGWMTSDYEQAGIPLDRAGVRIDRLAEALPIIKGLLGGETVHHEGEHYRIDGLTGSPRTVQQPHPPILIGGGGRRVLTLAAQEADIVGLNIDLRAGVIDERAGPNATVEATEEKLGWIRDAAGDRFDDLELQVRVHLAMVTDDRTSVAETMAPALGLSPAAALQTPHALVGTVEEICDQLVERRERWGISYIGIGADQLDDVQPVIERLAGT
ncbi:TIGR03621 family F420-dependent LLM class oxidoreductase [Actinomarinicola tropica]|uniref:TIGR03621 family F420-dependent LLM class oxidoreductase n=1 Tax=Actinomarinicola tropica TaxID=2789776 RepID=A0A5Q2RAM1_9ACTN|nr:TIGR03621 family F420-dependent LLM class oxidoreductase [Actinomarinicola tropica]QGG93919.1 TIGR03621 family F420-dependent LLM class oxidoreductase [Actinomarinicola tropica]